LGESPSLQGGVVYFAKTDKMQENLVIDIGDEKISLQIKDGSIYSELLNAVKNYPNKLNCQRITEDTLEPGNLKEEHFYNDKDTLKEFKISKNCSNTLKENILLLTCIDAREEKIRVSKSKPIVGKNTSRTLASITLNLSKSEQEKLIPIINSTLNKLRDETGSLFLTNFRDNGRKRIGFDFFYKLINYCYFEIGI
jgi:hypothetical protein